MSNINGSQSHQAIPRVLVNSDTPAVVDRNRHTSTSESKSKRSTVASRSHSKADVFREVVETIRSKKDIEHVGVNKEFDIDDEREYDTDIELEGKPLPAYDQWGRHVYTTTCEKIGINPLTPVMKALRKNAMMMKGQSLGWKDALALSFCLLENVNITVLNLDGNNVGAKGAKYVSCMLSENTVIRNLSMADNSIGNEGAKYIIDTLLANQTVIRCSLSGNEIDDGVAEDIAELLTESKSLTDLNLSHNHITDAGATIIARAIAENEYLKILNLSWNKIRPNGMVYLFNGLQQNASLNELDVSMNGVDVAGAEGAAEMLKSNRTLKVLDMTNTRLPDQGLGMIATALSVNDSLQTLKIPQNSITASGASVLADCLKKNDSSALTYIDLSTTHVLQDFMDDLEELKKGLPNMHVDVGGIVRTYHSLESFKANDLSNKNPLTLLRWYVASKGLRLIDLFRQFDKDNDMTVTRDEFIQGLNAINMPLTTAQLERLIDMLDKDGDGEVDYGEFIEGDKEHRKKLRKLRGSLQQQQHMAVEKLLSLPNNSPSTTRRSSLDVRNRTPRVSRDENRDSMSDMKPARNSPTRTGPTRKISTVIPPRLSES